MHRGTALQFSKTVRAVREVKIMSLGEHHEQTTTKESGINPGVIEACAYRTVTIKQAPEGLGVWKVRRWVLALDADAIAKARCQ